MPFANSEAIQARSIVEARSIEDQYFLEVEASGASQIFPTTSIAANTKPTGKSRYKNCYNYIVELLLTPELTCFRRPRPGAPSDARHDPIDPDRRLGDDTKSAHLLPLQFGHG